MDERTVVSEKPIRKIEPTGEGKQLSPSEFEPQRKPSIESALSPSANGLKNIKELKK